MIHERSTSTADLRGGRELHWPVGAPTRSEGERGMLAQGARPGLPPLGLRSGWSPDGAARLTTTVEGRRAG